MSKTTTLTICIVLAILFFAIAIYYFIPGYNHLFSSHSPMDRQTKHTLAFAGLGVLSILVALVNRPKNTEASVPEKITA